MKKTVTNSIFLLFVMLVMILSIWGPEAVAEYQDHTILGQSHIEAAEEEGEGYRYTLNSNERLYLLAQCLNSQTLPESEQNAEVSETDTAEAYDIEGTYAFVVNHRGMSGKEASDSEIFSIANRELDSLKELGILPEEVRQIEESEYDAVLYSAIDVPEPRNNLEVWKLSLKNSQKKDRQENRLIDLYLDADTGKIYEFYARTGLRWEQIGPDIMIERWSDYMNLKDSVPYEDANPLMEMTPYFKKYIFEGMGNGNTVVTIGFYEGINEIFLKISK